MLCPVPDAEEELSTHRLLHINSRVIRLIQVPSRSFCPSHIFPIPVQGTSSSKLLSQKETPNICSGPLSFPWLMAHIQSSSKGVGSIFKIYFKHIHTSHPSVVRPAHGLVASPRFTAEMCQLLRLLPPAHPDLFLNQQVGEQCFNKSHINLFIAHNPPVTSHLSNGLIISGSGPRPSPS